MYIYRKMQKKIMCVVPLYVIRTHVTLHVKNSFLGLENISFRNFFVN